MNYGRLFAIFWPTGLLFFVLAIMLSLPLTITAVPGGILDHQAAGTAAEVDRIHRAWHEAGVYRMAGMAMVADLVFIGIYALGCFFGGCAILYRAKGMLRPIGIMVCLSAIIFCVTDYGETIAQYLQYSRGAGELKLAAFAADMQPIKMVSFLAATIGVIAGLLLTRFTQART